MNKVYEKKVVLITGARRGIGRILVNHFLDGGAFVIGFSRHAESDSENSRYKSLIVNIEDPDSVANGFNYIREHHRKIDILINNAGVLMAKHSMIMSASSAKSMIDTNLFGTFLVSREAAKLMSRQKWGRIIYISSMAAKLGPIGDSVYAATKVAATVLANVMSKEFSSFNITCNTLGITAIKSDMLDQLAQKNINDVIAELPIPRLATERDILNVIDFFASVNSDYISAQSIFLGGIASCH